ncbi:unnamed protein product [Acanthoscelides obtectus]|uniref:Uncharacterized protein n=1 Tax=Acanthoscelides obtectus TaxID=200917 RepID=A0A9P0QGH3_ACAOB|nr:unnamed protein product [Acanthoscelides obtectus]CAK1689505.1 hypothetical protein AOBTE_LOCUS37310 [Acanthoscelides obtectus]
MPLRLTTFIHFLITFKHNLISIISRKTLSLFIWCKVALIIMGEPNEMRKYGQWSEADMKAALNVFS